MGQETAPGPAQVQPLALARRPPAGPDNRARAGGREDPHVPGPIDDPGNLHRVLRSLAIRKGRGDTLGPAPVQYSTYPGQGLGG